MPEIEVAMEARALPLSSIHPSKRNVRSGTDDALPELAESIRRDGVAQAIIVRPVKNGNGPYEIVCGERRWKASGLAGKESIPAVVRELTDEQADELRAIENLQRENLEALDEAKVFKQLQGKGSVEDVAAKTGKPASYVAQRLRLLMLIKPVQQALVKKQIYVAHALEIAKYRPAEQEQIAAWFLRGKEESFSALDGNYRRVTTAPSVAALRLWIESNVLCNLEKAGFDLNDATIVPKMGACTSCQFNTANIGTLFPGEKDARCTVPTCFFEKRAHGIDVQLSELAKEKDVKKVFRLGLGDQYGNKGLTEVKVDGYMNYNSPIREVKPGEECKSTKLAMVVWKTANESIKGNVGQVTNICDDAKCAKHHGSGNNYSSPGSGEVRVPLKGLAFVEHKAQNLKKSFEQRVRWAVFNGLAAKLRVAKYSDNGVAMEIAAATALEHLYYDSCRDACKALGIDKPTKEGSFGRTDWSGSFETVFKGNLWALLLAVNAAEDIRSESRKPSDSRLFQLADLYKVDVKAIRKTLAATDSDIVAGMKKRAAQKLAREKKGAKVPKGKKGTANAK